ncbi:MAG: hypothetical protein D3909_09830 [Candidatus Electrothrix sp. ATG1]|nr:hypothetical protein [Candidatus Electrothrix sp. ATG1]MCI5211767.1 hypothetical protein [Candidatus Electrothrix sp. ATG2]
MSTKISSVIKKEYDCPLTRKHVQLKMRQNAQKVFNEPECCSNAGQCGCDVVQIICGMSYTVDWKKCSLYSSFKEH